MSSDSQILRTGVLFKKGSGSGPFGRRNWKPRYFVLTPTRLQYFTFEDGELKGELSLQGCDEGVLEVMPADSMKTGSSASTIWRVAINAPERRLLVAAGTEMEMNDWVDKLVMAFRINAGQPMVRASLPAPSLSHSMVSGGCSTGIQDFHNFSIPRRGANQRHSIGTDVRASIDEPQLQAVSGTKQQMEETERLDEAYEHEHELQRQEAEMRRQLAVQKEEQEVANKLQRQKEQEQRMQQEREWQMQQKNERQQLHEMQPGQEAFAKDVQVQHAQVEVMPNRPVTDERLQQERRPSQPSDALLELQRRQKREEHARERAERKKAVQQQQDDDLAFRLSQHLNSHLGEDDNHDNVESSGQKEDDTEGAAVVAPHSSLVGNVKREMIQKQTQEHQRRREAILQQAQQMRQQEAARVKVEAHVAPREVEVAPREIEIVRRAPVKPSTAAPLGSFEF